VLESNEQSLKSPEKQSVSSSLASILKPIFPKARHRATIPFSKYGQLIAFPPLILFFFYKRQKLK
jgi:hypothetical protein